jgi:UDP-3-O-[3-hydroxymyristoyl] glucosamine N-acyltransferase
MIDPRFYETLGPVSVRALAGGLHAEGDVERPIMSVAPLGEAGDDHLCYADGLLRAPLAGAPGAVILRAESAPQAGKARAIIVAPEPRAAYARLASSLIRPRAVDDAARIHPSAEIEDGAVIAATAIVGAGARIGAGVRLGPNVVVGPGVAIGRGTRVGGNVVIGFALIGDAVTILAGAVIGESGFGVAGDAAGLVDIPHFGRVIIQDRATIGANTTIDRGMFGDTTIGEEAKLDNLCQIGHNVTIGRRARMAAFGGISGSCRIGDDVQMGGRVGLADHRQVGDGATLAAGSGVIQDVPPGETWGGFPARPLRAWMREIAWLRQKVSGKRDGK